jgi:nucleotide-binding universal stress UspA family protein
MECDVTDVTRILCAIDSAQPSAAAFRHALTAAKLRNAELHLVCAVPATRSFSWRARERTAHLAELRRIATAADVQVKVSVQHGEPGGVILLHANSSNLRLPDLIVLGTHGRRGVDRLRLGSVAERVMHRASCPTLVMPNSTGEAADGLVSPFDRILCAVDFSPASLAAFGHAASMARRGASALRVLHVVNAATPSMPRFAWEFASADHSQALAKSASGRLRSLLGAHPDLYWTAQIQVVVGFVEEAIRRVAADMKADVLVIGVRRAGIVRRLIGSVTARVLRTIALPVLAMPEVKTVERAPEHEPAPEPLRLAA